MGHRKGLRTCLAAVCFMPVMAAGLTDVSFSGQEADTPPPHLIQTVTNQDLYEGMLALGFLENALPEAEESEAVYHAIKDSIVRISMGDAYGSGMIWEMTPGRIVVVTNRHVLDCLQNETALITFPVGRTVPAEVLGVSQESDIGFAAVVNSQFPYEELEQLRYVRKDLEAFALKQPGDRIFSVGAERADGGKVTERCYEGSIGDMWRYLEDFGAYMIYGYGFAKAGMSGGGVFDAKGNLIGMLSGTNGDGMIAAVPLSVMLEAWEELK